MALIPQDPSQIPAPLCPWPEWAIKSPNTRSAITFPLPLVCVARVYNTLPLAISRKCGGGGCKVPLSQPQITLSLLDGKPSERGENSD